MTDFNDLTDNLSDEEHDFVYNNSSNIFTIYVIECDGSKYYIGKTNKDVSIRFTQHKSSDNTCAWTTKYKPIKIVETIKSNDSLDEDKITKKYMLKYGIENVRGGAYVKVKLDDWMIKSLEHELIGSKDLCYNCKERGHLYRNCDYKECSLNNKFNIVKYIERFSNICDINFEIDRLDKIYEQIIILNSQINTTSNIDINIAKQYITAKKELEKINKEYNPRPTRVNSPEYISYQSKIKPFNDLISDFQMKYGNYSYQFIQHVNNIYALYFTNNQLYINSENNIEIKIYKLMTFNLEKKNELKKILDIERSEEIIKMKLEGLYEKKIYILKKN